MEPTTRPVSVLGRSAGELARDPRRGVPFLITVSFFLAFLGIRLSVWAAGSADSEFATLAAHGLKPDRPVTHFGKNIVIRGYHIHHFYIGAALLAIAGWAALNHRGRGLVRAMAVVYGVGLGLFMDEIGLLLTWGDYWSRLSYTLTLIVGGFFLSVVLFNGFWHEVRTYLIPAAAPHRETAARPPGLVHAVDRISELVWGFTPRFNQGFMALVYLVAGCLIIRHPTQTPYWVAGGFLLQAISLAVRAIHESHAGRPPAPGDGGGITAP